VFLSVPGKLAFNLLRNGLKANLHKKNSKTMSYYFINNNSIDKDIEKGNSNAAPLPLCGTSGLHLH
jgi:hypothetical protein